MKASKLEQSHQPNANYMCTVNKWTDEFRGKWQDENMTAEEFVREIRANRTVRKTVDV